ncbi:unnamed protein product, partial [marine sediment metagenome]
PLPRLQSEEVKMEKTWKPTVAGILNIVSGGKEYLV